MACRDERYLVPVLFEPYARAVVAHLAPHSPARVLELACGTGTEPESFVRELTPRLIALGGDATFTPDLAAIVISAIR